MTEIPIEVSYRSYIKLLRKKWDIVYYGKDLYFSHANKILEPFYDPNTKEFYGIETNPTRLAIVKFLDQFREGPGLYETDTFPDLLTRTVLYGKREKVRKPFCMNRHQESHPSLKHAVLQEQYQFQQSPPKYREVPPSENHPYQSTYIVEDHPYYKMIGRIWTYIYIPSPADLNANDDFEKNTGYYQWLLEVCTEGHDMIILEPITSQFYVKLVKQMFSWGNLAIRLIYLVSIMKCCHEPHKMFRNLLRFLGVSACHMIYSGYLETHPLGRYKLPDRFHDTEALAELKYFREILPVITSKNIVLLKDEKCEVREKRKVLDVLHFMNLLLLGYNYMYGIEYWYLFKGK